MPVKKPGQKINIVDIFITLMMTLFGLIILYPFYNAVIVSIVPMEDYIRTPFLIIPHRLDFAAYKYVLSSKSLLSGMKVTTLILFLGVAYNMIITVFTAYALTKPIPGKKFITYAIIFTMYFTGGLIPYYLLIKQMGLMDNILSMILPTGINFMYMVVIKSYIEDLPAELEESAKIDGANDIIILFKIILPLTMPIMATFALYYGVERWNEWWNGMLFIKSGAKLPLQLVLRNIIQDATQSAQSTSGAGQEQPFADGVKMASVIVTMFPIMCLYPFLQKYFVTGLTIGAVKG